MRRLVLSCLISLVAAPAAAADCKPVHGKWSSVPAAVCLSPVGMCTTGELHGGIRGEYGFVMGSLAPANDPTLKSVAVYTGTSTMVTTKGTIIGTDSGSIDLNPFGTGAFAAVILILGGTERYEGATGFLQIRGRLDFTTGAAEGDYAGEICKR